MTGKPKEIRVRHKRENTQLPMGLADTGRHAGNCWHLLDTAANTNASGRISLEPAAALRLISGTFNQAACAAIIR